MESDLNRLKLLVEAVCESLGVVARYKDSERLKMIRCAFDDVKRALWFWHDGRMSGMGNATGYLARAKDRLVSAAKSRQPLERAHLASEAHKDMILVLHEVKQALAECREKEVAHAC